MTNNTATAAPIAGTSEAWRQGCVKCQLRYSFGPFKTEGTPYTARVAGTLTQPAFELIHRSCPVHGDPSPAQQG